VTDGALAGGVVDNCIGFYNHKYFILMASTASFIPSIAGHRNSANGQNDRVGEVLVSLLVAYGWMLCLSTFIMIALKYVWIGYSVRLSLSLCHFLLFSDWLESYAVPGIPSVQTYHISDIDQGLNYIEIQYWVILFFTFTYGSMLLMLAGMHCIALYRLLPPIPYEGFFSLSHFPMR
jgi:hypothetical protein